MVVNGVHSRMSTNTLGSYSEYISRALRGGTLTHICHWLIDRSYSLELLYFLRRIWFYNPKPNIPPPSLTSPICTTLWIVPRKASMPISEGFINNQPGRQSNPNPSSSTPLRQFLSCVQSQKPRLIREFHLQFLISSVVVSLSLSLR